MKAFLRAALLALMLIALCLLVPSPSLVAGAEEIATYQPLPENTAAPYPPIESCYLPDGAGYIDDSLSVLIRKERAEKYETDVLIVDIDIKDVSQLRTARAGLYGSKATALVTEMARRNNAVIAMNGDYFSYHDFGYVVRNGVLLRNRPTPDFDILIIDTKGDLTVMVRPTREMVDAFEGTALHAFSFGPALIQDGEKILEPGRCDSGHKFTQRIALCQRGPLSYTIVSTEGPENVNGRGFTIPEFIDYLYEKGEYQQAYNFDGGSSSTVAFQKKKINSISSYKTRYVGDIIYFATLLDGEAR